MFNKRKEKKVECNKKNMDHMSSEGRKREMNKIIVCTQGDGERIATKFAFFQQREREREMKKINCLRAVGRTVKNDGHKIYLFPTQARGNFQAKQAPSLSRGKCVTHD